MEQKITAAPHDYLGIVRLLDFFPKRLVIREVERVNMDEKSANAHFQAWQNIRRLVRALAASGIEPEEVITWLEKVVHERQNETFTAEAPAQYTP